MVDDITNPSDWPESTRQGRTTRSTSTSVVTPDVSRLPGWPDLQVLPRKCTDHQLRPVVDPQVNPDSCIPEGTPNGKSVVLTTKGVLLVEFSFEFSGSSGLVAYLRGTEEYYVGVCRILLLVPTEDPQPGRLDSILSGRSCHPYGHSFSRLLF